MVLVGAPAPSNGATRASGLAHARGPVLPRGPDGHLPANIMFAGVVFLGFANGVSERVAQSLARDGVLLSALNTFDISIVLWGACVAAILKLLDFGPQPEVRPADLAAAGAAIALFLLPIPSASWVGLSWIAFYLFLATPRQGPGRRIAALVLVLTVPLFWARILFAALSDTILRADAALVGWLTGVVSNGNVVPFVDGTGSMFIGPSCSSLSNLSLAILCSVALVNYMDKSWTWKALSWSAATCGVVVLINVCRIGLIGLYPARFDLIHGPTGATVAGWLTLVAIVAMTWYGTVRHASVDR